jgi:phosphomannomutase
MVENDLKFSNEDKERIKIKLFEEKQIPELGYPVQKVSYIDGLKIYFENGGWVIARFSGTEPLLRIFAEMKSEAGLY